MAQQTPPAPPAPAYVYTEDYLAFDYGPSHPLSIARLSLTHELIGLCGLTQPSPAVRPATIDELALYHDRRYLDTLREASQGPSKHIVGRFGLGTGDNPLFPGVYDWCALACGASLGAARLVAEAGHPAAFSMAGGMHHALAGRAAGFCYVNDPVVVIRWLLDKGCRVAYVDIDAHHGDGVQWAFYDSDQVLTISLHQDPTTLFPGTGYVEEMGREAGKGHAINVPLWPDTNDEIYTRAFDAVVPPALEAFAPDYVVTQLGVDTFLDDPLANLNLTTRGFAHVLGRLRELCWGKWIALGGGGYHTVNVARAWTLAWATLLGRQGELPRELPAQVTGRLRLRGDEALLLDDAELIRGRNWARAQREADEAVNFIRRGHFPILGARG